MTHPRLELRHGVLVAAVIDKVKVGSGRCLEAICLARSHDDVEAETVDDNNKVECEGKVRERKGEEEEERRGKEKKRMEQDRIEIESSTHSLFDHFSLDLAERRLHCIERYSL